ncbi:hypothetical protein HY640_04920 [Candidatus Woesearchaeota archaeon]|nr:hypothetical protein [Candidatus Woesearchaeota archaeon]
MTVRVHSEVSKAIDFLTKERNKTKADLIRELMSKAVREEQLKIYLEKYRDKEITLRTLAKNMGLPLWKAYELASTAELPYSKADLQRDLKLAAEA